MSILLYFIYFFKDSLFPFVYWRRLDVSVVLGWLLCSLKCYLVKCKASYSLTDHRFNFTWESVFINFLKNATHPCKGFEVHLSRERKCWIIQYYFETHSIITYLWTWIIVDIGCTKKQDRIFLSFSRQST